MKDEHTINSLVRRRATIVGFIEHEDERLRQLLIDLDHVDATIRMYVPDIDLEVVKVRRVPPPYQAGRGEVSAIALRMFRVAGSPLTSNDIVEEIIKHRELDRSDLSLRRLLISRIGATLHGWNRQGLIKEVSSRGLIGTERRFKAWTLVK